jgi:hypothetical protein
VPTAPNAIATMAVQTATMSQAAFTALLSAHRDRRARDHGPGPLRDNLRLPGLLSRVHDHLAVKK